MIQDAARVIAVQIKQRLNVGSTLPEESDVANSCCRRSIVPCKISPMVTTCPPRFRVKSTLPPITSFTWTLNCAGCTAHSTCRACAIYARSGDYDGFPTIFGISGKLDSNYPCYRQDCKVLRRAATCGRRNQMCIVSATIGRSCF